MTEIQANGVVQLNLPPGAMHGQSDVVVELDPRGSVTMDGVRKALVSIGGGKLALFECEAEPPKQRVARQPKQRLPANWKKIRGKVLAKVRSK